MRRTSPYGRVLSPGKHDALFSRMRVRSIAGRLKWTCLITFAMNIPMTAADAYILLPEWGNSSNLLMARLVIGGWILWVALRARRLSSVRHALLLLAAAVLAGLCLYAYSVYLFYWAGYDPIVPASIGTYFASIPILIVVGLSFFPLTLIEAIALAAPSLALVISLVWLTDGFTAHPEITIVIPIMLIAAAAAVGQTQLLITTYRQASIDSLTSALSRATGVELLQVLFEQSRRSNTPFSELFLDLDGFKAVNDRFGHDSGDEVLKGMVQRIKSGLRAQDVVIRWGGEGFVILLSGADQNGAAVVARRVTKGGVLKMQAGWVQTVSFGGAERMWDRIDRWEELVRQADTRLLKAKSAGKDQLLLPDIEILNLSSAAKSADSV